MEISETYWKIVCKHVNNFKALIKYTNCQWNCVQNVIFTNCQWNYVQTVIFT